MVFMPALSENQYAYERIRNLLEKFPLMVGGEEAIPVSISIGVVFLGETTLSTYGKLYEQADKAMYQAKKSGKGKAVFYDTASGESRVLEKTEKLS